jgi:coproporphyrinogen III oxidase
MKVGPDEFTAVELYLRHLQDKLCAALESEDGGGKFATDLWHRPAGAGVIEKIQGSPALAPGASGGGDTRILADGKVFERAGVGFSLVSGDRLPSSASKHRPELAGRNWRAAGVSLVIHPRSPYVPTTHCNVRFFVAEAPGQEAAWWFGGGFDLTPVYPFDEDARDWHLAARAACQPAGPRAYSLLKDACDKYFYLPHRGETRGIGGLFADDLNEALAEIGGNFEHCFGLIRRIGDAYLQTYTTIVRRRVGTPFGSREQDFQRLRRGRYVEFNLAFDRGTRFGLQSSARTESLLMSLPPRAEWRYDYRPEAGSPEARLGEYLKPRDWLGPA